MSSQEVEKCFRKNRYQILRVFQKAQLVESWLYMRVYFNKGLLLIEPKERVKMLNDLLKKPMSCYINKYKELFPKKKKIHKLLEIINKQRNSFMHTLYVWCLLIKDKKEIEKGVTLFLNSFEKNLDKVLDFLGDKKEK